MATTKKNTKSTGAKKPMRDLKPSKDAKGGARHGEANRGTGKVQQNLISQKGKYLQ